jgi:hypothetical protein
MDKLSISAIVVGFNEGSLLENCFNSLNFCDEIIYYDLGSEDNSIEIAKAYSVKCIPHERVPLVEYIHAKYYKVTKHDWILIIDPDEVVSNHLSNEIIRLFSDGISSEIGSLSARWLFYFKKRPLSGTAWGGEKEKVFIIHKERFVFTRNVHYGRHLIEGYVNLSIKDSRVNVIHHYWMRSYTTLFKKHFRYLKYEAIARFNNGQRTTFRQLLKVTAIEFYYSFFIKKGFRDFGIGLFLSIFWSFYQTVSHIKLYFHQFKN